MSQQLCMYPSVYISLSSRVVKEVAQWDILKFESHNQKNETKLITRLPQPCDI